MQDTKYLFRDDVRGSRGARSTANHSLEAGRAFSPRCPRLRRLVFFALVGLSTATAAMVMALILVANGFEWIELAILVLFTINFLLIALSFWSATAGFVIQALGLDPISLRRRR